MKQFLISIILLMFLVSCGGSGTTTVDPTPDPQPKPLDISAVAGTYNGDFNLTDTVKDLDITGLTTFTISAEGVIDGTVAVRPSSAHPFDEMVTYKGTLEVTRAPENSVLIFDFDSNFEITIDTIGVYTSEGGSFSRVAEDFSANGLPVKNPDGVFVGNLRITGDFDN